MATQQPWNPVDGINTYNVVAAVPGQSTATPAVSTNIDPNAAGTADAATRTLNPNELMSTQVNNVIAQDSPLMQQAAAKASQAANQRGLLNTSMAMQAGQAAVMDRAMPIAQYDAGANTNVFATNQANQQQTGIFNAGQVQDINKFNASADMQTSQFNAGEANKVSIVNASESNKILAQMMDQETKKQLADIEASYKVLMQSEASAMSMYQQSVKNISEILMNPDLTPEAKKVAVANQNELLQSGMQIIGAIGGLNLDGLLTFPDVNMPAQPA
jgi:hypothetical protein